MSFVIHDSNRFCLRVARMYWLRMACLVLAHIGVLTGCEIEEGVNLIEINPNVVSARGGEELILTGEGLSNDTTVTLGDEPTVVLESSSESLTILSPRLIAGTYDVTVTLSGGKTMTMPEGITVEPLELSFQEAAAHFLPDLGDRVVQCASSGDIDGDGDPDVILGFSAGPAMLMANDGSVFEEPSEDIELPILSTWDHDTREILLTDFDGDGDPDLFACNGSGESNRLLDNNGSGHFREIESFPARIGSCLQATSADLDGDGLPEIVTLAGREVGESRRVLRVYQNQSTSSSLNFALAEELEPTDITEIQDVGSVWFESESKQSASFTLSAESSSAGIQSGLATYDFAGIDGYIRFYLSALGARTVPNEIHFAVKGDGSAHSLTLCLRDVSGEQFCSEQGSLDSTEWQTIIATDPTKWESHGGDENGVIDPPMDRMMFQLNRVPESSESGFFHLDEVVLVNADQSTVRVEDFERYVPLAMWDGDEFTCLIPSDFDGDGMVDLALTAQASSTEKYLRVLRNDGPTGTSGDLTFRFFELANISPPDPVLFGMALDLKQDDVPDLFLITADRDRSFVNDGGSMFFDDTTSLVPVDQVDGRHGALGDLNLDGLPDLVIANYGSANRLYLNSSDGRLLDSTPSIGLERQTSRLVLLLDADGDGVLDVLIVNDTAPRLQLYISTENLP